MENGLVLRVEDRERKGLQLLQLQMWLLDVAADNVERPDQILM